MILGFSDLELALSDISGAAHYLALAYDAVPESDHYLLTRIIELLDSIEDDLCDLFERVERDDE
jgi:hypothetical protein